MGSNTLKMTLATVEILGLTTFLPAETTKSVAASNIFLNFLPSTVKPVVLCLSSVSVANWLVLLSLVLLEIFFLLKESGSFTFLAALAWDGQRQRSGLNLKLFFYQLEL